MGSLINAMDPLRTACRLEEKLLGSGSFKNCEEKQVLRVMQKSFEDGVQPVGENWEDQPECSRNPWVLLPVFERCFRKVRIHSTGLRPRQFLDMMFFSFIAENTC